jgi:POT family proton-dependent oligopeptide transporter
VANIAHIPEGLNDPVESLRIYTHLFNELGFAGLACTALALAMLPLMKRLSASNSEVATAGQPLVAVASE